MRVLQIPGDHPYVRQIDPSRGSPGQIPSPALTLGWLDRHGHEFDLVHLHFGYEHLSEDDVRRWLRRLAELRLPLVLTVHDLRNPHQADRAPHDRHLDLLIPAAAAILTLTPGAAAEIGRRWGRTAEVVAHPAIFETGDQPGTPSAGRVLGVHFKDLRRNIVEPDRIVAAALSGARAAHGRLRVDLHPGVAEREELRGTRRLARRGEIDLFIHPRFTDQALAAYLGGLHAYLLPNRWGTHSGWLEACRDMGTRVVAPSCGYYADQWNEVLSYQHDELGGLDSAALERAVEQALTLEPARPASRWERREQRDEIRAVHAEVYEKARRRTMIALDPGRMTLAR